MARPTIEEVRAYLKVPESALSDPDLIRMYAASIGVQDRRCRTPADDVNFPDALGQALLRRVQRQVAGRNLPLGMVGVDASEFGPSRIPVLDALIAELEAPFRKVVFG